MPLVKIDTAADPVPLIIERVDTYEFQPGERSEYREATDDEYGRWLDYYNGEGDES